MIGRSQFVVLLSSNDRRFCLIFMNSYNFLETNRVDSQLCDESLCRELNNHRKSNIFDWKSTRLRRGETLYQIRTVETLRYTKFSRTIIGFANGLGYSFQGMDLIFRFIARLDELSNDDWKPAEDGRSAMRWLEI